MAVVKDIDSVGRSPIIEVWLWMARSRRSPTIPPIRFPAPSVPARPPAPLLFSGNP